MPVSASLHEGLKSVKWNKPCPLEVSFGHVVEHENRNQMRTPIPKQGKVINYTSEGKLTNWTLEGKLSELTNGVRRIGQVSGLQSLSHLLLPSFSFRFSDYMQCTQSSFLTALGLRKGAMGNWRTGTNASILQGYTLARAFGWVSWHWICLYDSCQWHM